MHRPWPYPRIIGHRGGGALAPENTLAGFRKAAAMGFGGVEFDVMLSSDKVPLLIHDETLDRTTSGRGDVSATTTPRSPRWTPVRGSVRNTAASACHASTTRQGSASNSGCGLTSRSSRSRIRARDGGDRVRGRREALGRRGATALLSSFQKDCLEVAQAAAPDFERGYLTDRVELGWHEAARQLGCVSVHCNHLHLSKAQVDAVKRAGYWLLCYTVNEPSVARRLFSWGVDAIFTDHLDLISPDFA